MTRTPAPTPSGDDLQFDRAEYEEGDTETASDGADAAMATCILCKQPIADRYFTVNQNVVCPDCLAQLHANLTGGSGTRRLLAATAWGVGAGFLGALLWFAISKTTGYEIGLIAIVVGLMVGAAVRRGSKGRGGLAYQLLAVFLTYASITSTYVPDVFMAMQDSASEQRAVAAAEPPAADPTAGAPSTAPATAPNPPATVEPEDGSSFENAGPVGKGLLVLLFVLFLFAIAFIAPVLAGFENIIGLLIIAFALWEAWKINKRPQFETAGPFAIGAPPPASPPPPPLGATPQ